MSKYKKIIGVGIAVLAFVAGTAFAQSTIRSGTATVSRIDYVDAVYEPSTACAEPGGNYATLGSSTKSFIQGGLVANEVVVSFSASLDSGGPRDTGVRLLIDGVLQSGAGSGTVLSASPGGFGWTFISDPVTPGNHNAEIQWQTSTGDGCLTSSSMVIYHR